MGDAPWCRAAPDGVLIDVVVQPRASREGVGPVLGGRIKVRVHAPPVDDQANDAVVRVVARAAGVPPSLVRIVAGTRGRRKTLHLAGAACGAVLAALAVESA
jgi:hypothetical protein